MRIIFLHVFALSFFLKSNAQYTPNFSVNGKGINDIPSQSDMSCNGHSTPTLCSTYDVSGMNWYLTGNSADVFGFTLGTSTPPQPDHAKAVGGFFETQDPDGDICVTSPILNIAGLGTVTANYSVFRSGNCAFGTYSSPDDAVYSSYSLNGGAFVNSAMFTGACGSTSAWSQTFSGNTVVIRACFDANSIDEDYRMTIMNTNLGQVLPVKWSGFFVSPTKEGHCRLSWQTASEVNNDYFDVERSNDGIHFIPTGRVDGSGNRSEATNYDFLDETVEPGNTYFYRIKQVDFDGTTDYSVILSVEIKGLSLRLNISPNPVVGNVKIELNEALETDLQLDIYNANGQSVKTFQVNKGEFFYHQDLSDLPDGMYLIKSKGADIIQQKFIKNSSR